MLNKKLIVVTGSSGRFGIELQNSKIKIKFKKLFPKKNNLIS